MFTSHGFNGGAYWREIQLNSRTWVIGNKQKTVAYLRGPKGRALPPPGPNCFHFCAVFRKDWSNSMVAPHSSGVGAPSSGKSWIRHWQITTFGFVKCSTIHYLNKSSFSTFLRIIGSKTALFKFHSILLRKVTHSSVSNSESSEGPPIVCDSWVFTCSLSTWSG